MIDDQIASANAKVTLSREDPVAKPTGSVPYLRIGVARVAECPAEAA